MTKQFEKSKNIGWRCGSRFGTATRGNCLRWLLIAPLASALSSMACVKRVLPSAEQRVFFPNEVTCDKGKLLTNTGEVLDSFMIVGQGRYAEDQDQLTQCERAGLIRRKNQ